MPSSRAFLDSLVTRIIEVKDGRVRTFKGNYADYKAVVDQEENARREAKATKQPSAKQPPQKVAKPAPAKANKPRKKKGKPHNPWRIEQLENRIIELESEREELLESMGQESTFKDADKLRDVQMRLAEVERDLGETTSEWEQYAG